MDIAQQLQFVVSQIKKTRIQRGMSQMELSLQSNLSQSFLANLEKGKKMPSVLTVLKIADAMNVNVKDFFPEKPLPDSEGKQRVKNQIISLLERL